MSSRCTALEAELPKIAKTKKDGLCAWYNLASEDAQIYFDEHLKEEEHLQVWRGVPVDPKRGEIIAKRSRKRRTKSSTGCVNSAESWRVDTASLKNLTGSADVAIIQIAA